MSTIIQAACPAIVPCTTGRGKLRPFSSYESRACLGGPGTRDGSGASTTVAATSGPAASWAAPVGAAPPHPASVARTASQSPPCATSAQAFR